MERSEPTARVGRVVYSLGVVSASILVTKDGTTTEVPVRIGNLDQGRAISLVGAMGRLLTGAVVMDGADLLAIRDSIDNARGLAGELAPQHAAATLAVAAIEVARDRFAGCVS